MRSVTFLISCLLSAGMAWAEGGETCFTSTLIPCIPYTDSGNTSDNVNNNDYACPNASTSADVVYYYIPISNQQIRWSLCASGYNTKLYIYADGCGGALIVCNDDFPFCGPGNNRSVAVATMNAGVDYYIVIDGAGGAEGAYTLDADFVSCAPDYFLTSPGFVSGNTCGAANDCSLRPSEDQIVELNIPTAGNYRISLCNSNPVWNSYMYVTRGCCGGAIAESDDGGCTSSGLLSYIDCVYLEACQYHVVIEGSASNHCGNWTLNVSPHSCFPEYILYEPGSISGTTCGECSECALRPSPDAVVEFNFPQTGYYTFSFCTGDSVNSWDMVATFSNECCGSTPYAEDVGSCDAAFGGSAYMPCEWIVGGFTYFLQIEGLTASDCGPWTLTVTPGGADLYLNVPGTISGSTTGAGDDCNSSSGPDQVVQLNVPVGGIYTLSLCESAAPGAWDSRLYLRENCSCVSYPIAANDNGCPPPNSSLSEIECWYLDAGTYYAIVDGVNSGDWTLTVSTCPCEPYGILQAPGSISGNTCGYNMACDPFATGIQDVQVNIPWDGQYTFSFCSSEGVWNSDFALVTECCSHNYLAFENDFCEDSDHGQNSCLPLVQGTYFVLIYWSQMYLPTCGLWTLNVTACTTPAAPDSLVILATPPDIQLFWASFGGNVSYNVYRGDSSNFAIIPANLIGTTTASSFVDSGVTNTPEFGHFYAVTTVTP